MATAAEDIDIPEMGSLQPKRKTVTFDGQKYIVLEAEVNPALQFRNMAQRAWMAVKDATLDQSVGIADDEAYLVGQCVYQIQADGVTPHEAPIGAKVVGGWPHATMLNVYKLIRKMSPGLIEGEPTLEQVEKQIKDLDDKRRKLLDAAGGTPDPNVRVPSTAAHSPSAATSGSPSTK